MMDAQQLIDKLQAHLLNEGHARRRGDAKSIGQHKAIIADLLNQLEALGYDKLDCIDACQSF